MSWPANIGTIDVYRGDALSVPITVHDGAGAPVDLTAYGTTWTAMARLRKDDPTVVSFAVDTSQVAAGVLTLSLTGAQTGGLNRSMGFDVQVTGGPLSPLTLFRGTLAIDGDFTHA